MSTQQLLGALALSALVTLGIVKLHSGEEQKPAEVYIEPEDELDEAVQNLTYPQFLNKFDLPDNDDSLGKYKFIRKPDTHSADSMSPGEMHLTNVEKVMHLNHTKIKKLKEADKYEELSDYLDEKIRRVIDNPDLKYIKINDLKKMKSKLMYDE